jgi:hypothetical protein
MFVKSVFALAAIVLVGAGCSTDQPLAPSVDQAGDNLLAASRIGGGNQANSDEPVMFTVRIENVSTGMTLQLSNGETAPAPHSPGVWAITPLFNPLFEVGRYESGDGLEQQAEDGNPSMLAASLADNDYVISYGVFNTPVGDDNPGPATPGKAFEFTFMASPGDHLSLTTMFGQSNDLFYAPGEVGIPLFRDHKPMHGDITRYFKLWDAGTEVNQEPGLGSDQAPRQSAPNTGESEHKRVLPVHDEYTYPATDEVIKVTILPMDDMSG